MSRNETTCRKPETCISSADDWSIYFQIWCISNQLSLTTMGYNIAPLPRNGLRKSVQSNSNSSCPNAYAHAVINKSAAECRILLKFGTRVQHVFMVKIHFRSNPRWPTADLKYKIASVYDCTRFQRLSFRNVKFKTAVSSDGCSMSSTNRI